MGIALQLFFTGLGVGGEPNGPAVVQSVGITPSVVWPVDFIWTHVLHLPNNTAALWIEVFEPEQCLPGTPVVETNQWYQPHLAALNLAVATSRPVKRFWFP